MKESSWGSYEEVAQYLLNQFAEVFGLEIVEGKQLVPGKSGTDWEIDAKGLRKGDDGFVIVECRRHTTSRLNQESIGALAYRINDTAANSGIVVSPLPLQKGAAIIAAHEDVKHVILDPNSSTSEYILQFLNQVFIGLAEHITATDSVRVYVRRDGELIDKPNSDYATNSIR